MADQLLFLMKSLTCFHGVPIRKIDCCPISLVKNGFMFIHRYGIIKVVSIKPSNYKWW